jgi:hypothetical protein
MASALGLQSTAVLTINMATPLVAVALTATAITFGQTLASSTPSESFTNAAGVTVPGTLSFVNPGQVPKAGTTNVPVIFTPTDAADYNTVTNAVSVTVNMATPIVSVVLTATAITYGQTLASSTPSESFTNAAGAAVPGALAFVNSGQVPKAGITNVPVIFTPTDAADYNTVTNTVGVTVNMATPLVSVALTATAIIYGQTLANSTPSESFTNASGAAVPGTLAFANPGQVPKAGITNVPVIFTPTDALDYKTVTNTASVTVNRVTMNFTGLSSMTNNYGVTNIVLIGELSGSGPVYPASGEVVSATINGIAVNGSETNGTGGFWPLAGLQIRLEFFLERFASAMDERFGGGKRAVQNLGDFLVAQFVLPAEQNGGALVFRQVRPAPPRFFGQFAVQQIFSGGRKIFLSSYCRAAGLRVRRAFPRAIRRDGASGGGFRSGTGCARW